MAPNRRYRTYALLVSLALTLQSPAVAQDAVTETTPTFSVLYTFKGGKDGIGPGGVVRDSVGNLYGATGAGGELICPLNGSPGSGAGGELICPLNGSPGCGVVFKVDKTGKERVLYRFSGGQSDQGGPFAGVIRDAAGNLFGTTSGLPLFGGTVFKVDADAKEITLYSFTGGADGGTPEAELLQDATGNLFGTTVSGGVLGQGVVFELDTTGQQTVLYNFKGKGDGTNTLSPLISDAAGILYGTASGGGNFRGPCEGSGCGTLFMLNPTGKLTVLHTFTGGADGANPLGPLRDAAGNLYGTTSRGGDPDCTVGGAHGCGVVFKLDTSGRLHVLHTFTGGSDGGTPTAGVIQDAAGNLYGTTAFGGPSRQGVVFKLDTTGQLTVLHAFTGADGAAPNSLVRDAAGNLYGTAALGGGCIDQGCGTVFKISP